MDVRVVLLSTIATTMLSVSVHAAAGSPVAHSHNGRSHSHSLPTTGKNHTHNGKKKVLSTDAGKGWTNFSTASNSYYTDFKDGSYEERENKAGDDIGVLILKRRWMNEDKTDLEKAYIKKKDCLKGHGTIVFLNLKGEFQYETDFAEGAGLVSSSIARIICQFFKEDDSKSL